MGSGSVMRRREPWLPLRQVAAEEGIGLRTLERWKTEGLIVRRERSGRVLVNPVHVRAWLRWKSLRNGAERARRARAVARGETGAQVSDAAMERARREWIAAGGSEEGKQS